MLRSRPVFASRQILFLALPLLGACSLWPWGRTEAPVEPTPVIVRPPIVFAASAAYRLVVDPGSADAPSRLQVLYARIQNAGDQAIVARSADIQFRLPDDTPGRIFDPPRVAELLRRTSSGMHDLSYLQSPGGYHPPGGLEANLQYGVDLQIIESLLDMIELAPGATKEGYLVVDTRKPFASLAGATLELVATRSGDGAPVRQAYRMVAPQPVAAAQ